MLANHYRKNWSLGRIWVKIAGFKVHLDPQEAVDNALLFTFKWVDTNEHRALKKILRPGDCFVDVGANIGWYSLNASHYVGPQGRVVAIEANPEMADVIESHLQANDITNVELFNFGASNKHEHLKLWIHTNGNLGRSTLLQKTDDEEFRRAVEIECKPLIEFVDRPVRMMKLDIEGLEFTVLQHYLAHCESYPEFILTEQWMFPTNEPNAIGLLLENGYEIIEQWDHNFLLASRN